PQHRSGLAGAAPSARRPRLHGGGLPVRPPAADLRHRLRHVPCGEPADDARRWHRHRGPRDHRPARRGRLARPLHVPGRKETSMSFDPRHKSRVLLDGTDRAAARSYFRAVGFTDEDLKKPLVGVAHCWIELTPCNANHRKLAEKVKEGIRTAGGTPIEFNTISATHRTA